MKETKHMHVEQLILIFHQIFSDYVNNVNEPDDKYSQEETVHYTLVAKMLKRQNCKTFW